VLFLIRDDAHNWGSAAKGIQMIFVLFVGLLVNDIVTLLPSNDVGVQVTCETERLE